MIQMMGPTDQATTWYTGRRRRDRVSFLWTMQMYKWMASMLVQKKDHIELEVVMKLWAAQRLQNVAFSEGYSPIQVGGWSSLPSLVNTIKKLDAKM